MSEPVLIRMFPINLLPLPGELVSLHIFETRYRQLLKEAEDHDVAFGIYFTNEMNQERLGSIVKLESVLKRYPGGESDIVLKCTDVFKLHTLMRHYHDKLYPGGMVDHFHVDLTTGVDEELSRLFMQYMSRLHNNLKHLSITLYEIANNLTLDLDQRYGFLKSPLNGKRTILVNRIHFLNHLLDQEEKTKNTFHLN